MMLFVSCFWAQRCEGVLTARLCSSVAFFSEAVAGVFGDGVGFSPRASAIGPLASRSGAVRGAWKRG